MRIRQIIRFLIWNGAIRNTTLITETALKKGLLPDEKESPKLLQMVLIFGLLLQWQKSKESQGLIILQFVSVTRTTLDQLMAINGNMQNSNVNRFGEVEDLRLVDTNGEREWVVFNGTKQLTSISF